MKKVSGRALPWGRFFWDDWLADAGLSCCSPAARGVWIDWLAHAAKGTPPGHVTIDGAPPTMQQLAKMGRCNPRALPAIMAELEKNGVFSRTPEGIIYSRRMVRDFEGRSLAVKYGKRGGNPALINGLDRKRVKPEAEAEAEAEAESLATQDALPEKAAGLGDSSGGHAPAKRTRATRGTRLPEDWQPSEADRAYAENLGLNVQRVADDFRSYWLDKAGKDAVKLGWSLTWQSWCRREADKGVQKSTTAEQTRRFL